MGLKDGISMNEIKKGDILKIHCYKHDGTLFRISEEAYIIDITDEYIVCGNNKTRITEVDGKRISSYRTKEPAIIFFYKNNWFNIIAQFKKYGLFYYCNIASPFIIDEGCIKYIDYDLDLRVFPNGEYKVLDINEYKYHKRIMNYSSELDYIVNNELDKLISMKKEKNGAFSEEKIRAYYDEYLEIIKNDSNIL